MGREHGETSAPTRPVGDRTASGLYPLNVALEAYDAARPRSYGAPAVLAVLAASPAAARVRRAAAGTALHAAVYGRHGDAVVLAVLRAEPARAGKESEIPNFKGSSLGRFPLVSADFWTSGHLAERSGSVNIFLTSARAEHSR